MARRKKMDPTRVDEFLPLLQRDILTLQDERTAALREIDALRKRVGEIDHDLEIMVKERDSRTGPSPDRVPDFPPVSEEDTEREDTGDAPFFDNSEFCRPGQAIFLPITGIDAPVKSKAYKDATYRIVRTWVYNNKSEWFKTGLAESDLHLGTGIIRKRLTEMVAAGVLEQKGNRASSKYKFVEPEKTAPSSRPRHDRPTTRVGGKPVPHTRAIGTSGKPGKDKKVSASGRRVKRRRQGT